MDTVMLNVKFLLFFTLEFSVLVVIGAVLIAGLYHIVRDRVRESRRLDEVAHQHY
jgi:hypothetical protein